jgi:hypothetical protein
MGEISSYKMTLKITVWLAGRATVLGSMGGIIFSSMQNLNFVLSEAHNRNQ